MKTHSQFALLREKRFGPYFLTQFMGAFNDNIYKNALIILIAFQGSSSGPETTHTLINLSAGLFILPFFLFSASAGQIADKYEKSRLIRGVKLLEIVIMLLAAAGFLLKNIPLLIGVLFLMGTQSALFGPLKYGILPQHLGEDELTGGNGMVEMGTFLAILLGTLFGGILISMKSAGFLLISITVISIAGIGYMASRGIPPAPPAAPDLDINWNLPSETWHNLKYLRENRTVFLSVAGISWFWCLGVSYLTQLPNYIKLTLGGNETIVTLMLTLFSMGIGIGSLLCEKLSARKVELGLVPLGAIGLTLFGLDLGFVRFPPVSGELTGIADFLSVSGSWRIMGDILLISLFGGFYIVPLYTLIQQRSDPARLSRIIAGNNILNALFMVFSALLAIMLLNAGFAISQFFLIIAVLNGLFTGCIFWLVPEFPSRFLVWIRNSVR